MAISEDDRRRMGTPDPALVTQMKQHRPPQPEEGQPPPSIDQLREIRAAHLAALRPLYPIPSPIPDQVRESEHNVVVRDGTPIRIRVYVPVARRASPSPLIVLYHEGGWTLGDLSDEDLNCRMFARDLGAVCVNVDYRLAPDHPFPQGVHDCWDVTKWCAANAAPDHPVLPADPRAGFIVGGASAGGNLAAVMAQLSRDEGLQPPVTGQYMAVPALLDDQVVPERWKAEYRSRKEATDPILSGDLMAMVVRKVVQPDPASPLFSPLLHENLKGLAPAFFQVAGLDALRDEGLLYERVLREENGVPTKLNVYDGFGHMFWTNWPELDRSTEFVNDTLSGFKWLLTQV